MKQIHFAPHHERAIELNWTKQLFFRLVLTVAVVFQHQMLLAAGPAPVNLRSTANFVILAGAGITTTGGGIINGDVGASPIAGSAIGVTCAQMNGTIYAVDPSGPPCAVVDAGRLDTAKGDLTLAFNDAAGRMPTPEGPFLNPGAGNIGGLNLGPGLYKFTGTASITGFPLTLTGGPDDVWIFQIASGLLVDSGIHVMLAGGAQARNIFWQVGASAVIESFAVFKGTILASQSITMGTSSSLEGRALASTAGVTYNGVGGALPIPEAPTFTDISTTPTNAVVVLETTPYFPVTLQTSTDLNLPDWTTIATNYPASSPWTFTNSGATTTVTQRFYRAFITTP